ncbi:MAG: hypothetical protein JJT76_12820 [Clostridiaceae bacterium]|nr:hypothetical protein [Clostridiaceae bacterium]
MNKGFGNYLWGLIRRALNTVDEVVEAYAKALGYIYDSLKEAAYRARRAWYIRTCSEDALYERGEERKLRRYPGESLEQYKNRLNSAIEIYSEGGTIPGMQRLLERLGYPDADIHELYKDGDVPTLYNGQSRYDGRRIYDTENRWAEFKITTKIERNATLRKGDYALLIELVNKAKPGHSRLAAFNIKVEFSERLTWPDSMALKTGKFAEEEIELTETIEVTKRKVIDYEDCFKGYVLYRGDATYDGDLTYGETNEINESLNITLRRL